MTADEVPGIAVVGMEGRFPGADGLAAFWRLLCAGQEGLTRSTADDLRAAGVPPELSAHPRYVPVNGVLEGIELFDAGFFGMSPREAAITDPQHRLFLELAWRALEISGHDPAQSPARVGVYAGCGLSSYLLHHLWPAKDVLAEVGPLRVRLANSQEYLATRLSYKLDLKGPSFSVNTACSTSLVAVHLACEALANFQCDLALAGGISIQTPQGSGYLHEPEGILSPDGRCRAFDAAAQGTVSGNGGGVVVLRRLGEAIEDGDTIYAVIRGSAVNNDGGNKATFTAPSVNGQRRVIVEAQEMADVAPETIGYVEAHGTGTPLGDPLEFAALTAAFRRQTDRTQFCALGSVKTNLGHLDEAAGVAGLIKTVLCLHHRRIPPSLHFTSPNPELAYDRSPFYVNSRLRDWEPSADGTPRRAAVSSFGIGGTNAHVVLEEAPAPVPPRVGRKVHLLTHSARSAAALDAVADAVAAHLLAGGAEQSLADVAYTLQTGRRAFPHRRVIVQSEDATGTGRKPAVIDGVALADRPVAFLFPGQGSQQVGMGSGLHEAEPLFREVLEQGIEFARAAHGIDLRTPLLGTGESAGLAKEPLDDPVAAPMAIFLLEHALARQWMDWGITPRAMIGHSVGEYVAACVAGVFTLEEGLRLLAARGRLVRALPRGGMLALPLAEPEVLPWLRPGLDLAAVTADNLCVVSGGFDPLDRLEKDLADCGVAARRLPTSHAYHSGMMTPMLTAFEEELRQIRLQPAKLPYLSNVTGAWIDPAQATDPAYWSAQLRRTVRFAEGLRVLGALPDVFLLEVGPGRSLTRAAMRTRGGGRPPLLAASMGAPKDGDDDFELMTAVGGLWAVGAPVDWRKFHAPAPRRRVPLPTYPFERQRHWIDAPGPAPAAVVPVRSDGKREDVAQWFYAPSWKRLPVAGPRPDAPGSPRGWLIFADAGGAGAEAAALLEARGEHVFLVEAGAGFFLNPGKRFTLAPADADGYAKLFAALRGTGCPITEVVHCWTLDSQPEGLTDRATFDAVQTRGYYSLLRLAQALHAEDSAVRLTVFSTGLYDVTGIEAVEPAKATLPGLLRVLPQEFAGLNCRVVDLPAAVASGEIAAQMIVPELMSAAGQDPVAWRGIYRWVQTYEPFQAMHPDKAAPLRQKGTYLITGGFGAVGQLLSRYLARQYQARLVLVGRSAPSADALEAVRALEVLGSEVLVAPADLGDESQFAAAVAAAEARFGPLHGVIHAAGLASNEAVFRLLEETDFAQSEAQFHPKAHGAMVLHRVLADRPLDFCLLMSSNAAVLGGLGMAAYAAANGFLDAFAVRQRRGGTPWISACWDGWPAAAVALPGSGRRGVDRFDMTVTEAESAFERVLASSVPHVIVSTGDLAARLAEWTTTEAGSARTMPGEPAPVPRPAGDPTPEQDFETLLTRLWRGLLGLTEVGAHDDFFALGGDSLLGRQLLLGVEAACGVRLPIRCLLEEPTIAALATRLREAAHPATRIPPAPPQEEYPLTHGQKRLWILSQDPVASVAYNMCYSLSLRGILAVETLRQAFTRLLARHEALRTAFVVVRGEPCQQIRPAGEFALPVLDLGGAPDQPAAVAREQQREAHRAFRLDEPPLLRACLLRLTGREHRLLVSLHHIVADGVALQVLMRELHEIYSALQDGRAPALPPLALQGKDFAVWQRDRLADAAMRAHRAYWLEQLGPDLPLLTLPLDRPRHARQEFTGAQVTMQLPSAATEALHRCCRANGATLFTLLAAALDVLLHHLTGQGDFFVGTPVLGREQPELAGQIGFYLNNVVLRAEVHRHEPFTELLQRVRRTVTDALAHQEYPFDLLVEELGAVPLPGRSPLFDVQLNLMPAETPTLALGDLTVAGAATANATTLFDLNFMCAAGPGGLALEIGYSTALFDAATVERWGEYFLRLLAAVGERPDTSVRALCDLLSAPDESAEKAAFLAAALNLQEEFS